jgi:hypothetical protein
MSFALQQLSTLNMAIKGRYQLVQDDFEENPIISSRPQSSFVQWLRLGVAVDACLLVLALVAFVYSLSAVKKLDDHELVVATNAYCNFSPISVSESVAYKLRMQRHSSIVPQSISRLGG